MKIICSFYLLSINNWFKHFFRNGDKFFILTFFNKFLWYHKEIILNDSRILIQLNLNNNEDTKSIVIIFSNYRSVDSHNWGTFTNSTNRLVNLCLLIFVFYTKIGLESNPSNYDKFLKSHVISKRRMKSVCFIGLIKSLFLYLYISSLNFYTSLFNFLIKAISKFDIIPNSSFTVVFSNLFPRVVTDY